MVVLIVPLWNWNDPAGADPAGPDPGFNRTFMELKLWFRYKHHWDTLVLIVPLWNWNTHGAEFGRPYYGVLIVPLWNWNLVWHFKEVLG